MSSNYIIPEDEEYRFTRNHIWVKTDDEFIAFCGITDYKQSNLSDIIFVEFPDVDMEYRQGETAGRLESLIDIENIYAPVSGLVVEVNSRLEAEPELINKDPYNSGWIFKIDIKHKTELEELLEYNQYERYID